MIEAFVQPADPGVALAEEVSRLEGMLERARAEDRAGLEDRVIEARARLIASLKGDDDRAPTWMIDQAASLLGRLARDASDTGVLTGYASAEARSRVAGESAEAATLLARSGAMIDRLAAGGGTDRIGGRGVVLALEKAVRVPFFQARAGALVAATREGEARREAATVAVKAGESLTLEDSAADALRKVNLALALLARGAAGDAERARSLVEEVLRATGDRGGGSPQVELWSGARAEAWFAWTLARGRSEGANAGGRAVDELRKALAREPFVVGGAPDPLLIVLAHDTMARALVEAGAGRNVQLMREASETVLSLMDREDLGMDRAARRALVSERIAALVPADAVFTQLPAGVAVARAGVVARREEGRSEALRLLTQAASREDAGAWREEALWELAVLLMGSESAGDRLRGVRSLASLARDFPTSPRANEALGAALAYGRDLVPRAGAGLEGEARAAYADVLGLACDGPYRVKDPEFWWCERARVVFEGTASTPERARARGQLERIEAGSPMAGEATRVYLAEAEAQLRNARGRHAAALARGDERGARSLAQDEVLPHASRALEWGSRHGVAGLDALRLDHAEAVVDAGRPGALAVFDDLVSRGMGGTRIVLGRARALLLEGRDEEGFGLLRDLASSLELSEPRPAEFWLAWTLMLEVLAEQGAERSGVVRTHVQRLRLLDPGLGGRVYAARIERVERSLR